MKVGVQVGLELGVQVCVAVGLEVGVQVGVAVGLNVGVQVGVSSSGSSHQGSASVRPGTATLRAIQGEEPLIYPVVDGQAVAEVALDAHHLAVQRRLERWRTMEPEAEFVSLRLDFRLEIDSVDRHAVRPFGRQSQIRRMLRLILRLEKR